MSIDRIVLAFAGSVVLLSLALSQLYSPQWLWLTVFVGANLLQSAFTGFCPLAKVLKVAGARPGMAFEQGPARPLPRRRGSEGRRRGGGAGNHQDDR